MKFFRLVFLFTLFGWLITSCDTYQPSQLCGLETEPDHTLFGEYFSQILLVNQTSSKSPNETQQVGRVFEDPASLVLDTALINDAQVRLCVFAAKIKGEVVFDETFAISAGSQSFNLGEFEEGPYIIRVYADSKLVENISFLIE
jgi:hypothetical protein